MKKVKTTLNIISFALVVSFAGITYFLVDNYRAIRKKKLQEKDNFIPTFHSYYPENYPEHPTCEDFNKWSSDIFKQIDHLKN